MFGSGVLLLYVTCVYRLGHLDHPIYLKFLLPHLLAPKSCLDGALATNSQDECWKDAVYPSASIGSMVHNWLSKYEPKEKKVGFCVMFVIAGI
ncbi:hypothetical protein B9Z19DRAFT_773505 [Tuber borchii]|uniref:Uncharacterized protein n=1 Tax=Tuber borchii TaxID=42251 RepID=A0A2T6ZWX6_TUBBO|nr:hypothetical protein B9Z19DRAFT_773505 [Tuber borchii]